MPDASLRTTFEASGRVGADLLAVDWDATPLGSPDTWPLSLSSAVRMMLSSKFSMWMAWGEELTFFCNDAYRRNTLASKYPWALGRSAREVWAEIWPEIGPRVERVISTGEATWDEALQLFLERSGYQEETYHTFSYSPLTADDGAIRGLLCVVAEVTEDIVNQRRMNTLRDLGIRVSTAESVADAVRAGCEHLALNDESLPWVATYLFDADGAAVLAGTAGIDPGHAAAPLRIGPDDAESVWPAHRLRAGEEVVIDHVDELIDDLPTGAWRVPPEKAVLVPIPGPLSATPYGFLVFGANRHRPVDKTFYEFGELIAAHFSSAITDARAMEQEKERSEALARLDQAKSDFLANVSHELRTPLTLLLGPAEDALADQDDPLSDTQRHRVELIARSGTRMLRLVNTLLDFSRLDAQREDASYFQATDLRDYTTQLASLFESPVARAGLTLVIEGDDDVVAFVDRNHWSRIVLNLLSNALKFTFAGTITVRVERRGSDAVLTVADTGTGIPEEEMSRLFERFHRVRGAQSRSIEGTGIGLALVAELAALHGGEVGATSTLGEGSAFTVRIPRGAEHLPPEQLARDEDDRSAAAVADRAAGGRATALIDETHGWLDRPQEASAEAAGAIVPSRAASSELATVLVVDDNADMRRYVAGTLADGYRVLTAGDGLDALDRLAQERVDLVITDVMMPRLDGFGLLSRMKERVELAAVPVIMVSARAGEEGTVEGLEAGADDYLVKPFSARELRARVRVNLEVERLGAVRDELERAHDLVDQAERIGRFGSWQVDLHTGRVRGSRTFADLVGLDVEALEALDLQGLVEIFAPPGGVDAALERLRSAPIGEDIAFETHLQRPAGEVILSVHGRVASVVASRRVFRGFVQDVTEQRHVQQQLISAEAARREARRERTIANELQHSLLPVVPPQLDHLELATYYRPGVKGTQVGGDWYDVIDVGAGRTAFVVGDVMGRGVRAAAAMGQVKSAARALARLDLPPSVVLEHLDGIVADVLPDGIVTCVYAVHDPERQALTYANAGNVPPLLVDADGAVLRLASSGPPLGAGYFATPSREAAAGPRSVLVLYTDGLVERRGEDLGRRLDDLERAVVDRRLHPLAELPTTLVELMASEVRDDVAVVVAAMQAQDPELVRRTLSGELSEIAVARHLVEQQTRAWHVAEDRRADLMLLTSELVTNAIRHGRGPIDVRLRRSDDEVVVEVSDTSPIGPRRRHPGAEEPHGRGLAIVEQLADRWGVRSASRGKVVWAAVRTDGA